MASQSPFNLTPKQAAAWFRAKITKPSMSWRDFQRSEHDITFTVSKLVNEDLLKTVKNNLQKAIEAGLTVKEFAENLKPAMEKAGWIGSNSRLKLIYRTNMATAYSAQYGEATGKLGGYYLYNGILDSRIRPLHKSWDGLILPVDSPFWLTHYPPNGWGCRCIVVWLSERGLKRTGRTKPDRMPKIQYDYARDPKTGRNVRKPKGIDLGWDYAPGLKGRAKAIKKS